MDPRYIQAFEDGKGKSTLHKYFNPKTNPEISEDQPNPVRPFSREKERHNMFFKVMVVTTSEPTKKVRPLGTKSQII